MKIVDVDRQDEILLNYLWISAVGCAQETNICEIVRNTFKSQNESISHIFIIGDCLKWSMTEVNVWSFIIVIFRKIC